MPDDRDETPPASPPNKPANIAPDAVKDPNEKTDGKPGMGGTGGNPSDNEIDPGGS